MVWRQDHGSRSAFCHLSLTDAMEFIDQFPRPFLFNALKHHAGFVREFIGNLKADSYREEQIGDALLKMGNSMIDFYFGSMSPREVINDIENHLKSMHAFEIGAYHELLERSHGAMQYYNMKISDHSTWTLLPGNNKLHYLHIHPARGSKHTIRVRAMALKTAVCLRIFYNILPNGNELINAVNEVRHKYLHESPIKNDSNLKGILRVLKFL